jgi:hypothetical protein
VHHFVKGLAASALVAGVALSGSASAQQLRNEVSFFGNIDSSSTSPGNSSQVQTSLFGSYGYYFTPKLVGTIGLGYFGSTSSPGSYRNDMLTMNFGAKYYFGNFKTGAFVPFVTGTLDIVSMTSTSGTTQTTISGGGGELGVGLSAFMNETTSFDASLNGYSRSLSASSSGSSSITTSGAVFRVGLTTRF